MLTACTTWLKWPPLWVRLLPAISNVCLGSAMKTIWFCMLSLLCTSSVVLAEIGFQEQTIDSEIQIGYGLAVGRVDSDELPDILLADKREIVWYQNPGERHLPWTKHVMARNLTANDNVCIAARDITGDGLVEVAVGANWNPGETSDTEASGASFYLQRPQDPTKPWDPKPLPDHEPTTHRMHWLEYDGKFALAVLPLHGVDNQSGAGNTVSIGLYDVAGEAPTLVHRVDTKMHMTHNFEFLTDSELGTAEFMLVAGKEGYRASLPNQQTLPVVGPEQSKGGGEVRRYPIAQRAFVGIEPMHGTDVVFYRELSAGQWKRELIDGRLSQGHALAAADLLGSSQPDIVAGWRGKDDDGKVGIKVYEATAEGWKAHVLTDRVACEDLKLADLDDDGKLDVVAAGRATKNVVIFWNQ